MGNLIRNLLVAAGLLSYPITDPLCQNLCHRQLTPPSPTLHPPPSCLIWHLCLGVLWWNAARLLFLCRCSLLAAVYFAAAPLLPPWLSDLSKGWGGDGRWRRSLASCLGNEKRDKRRCFPSQPVNLDRNYFFFFLNRPLFELTCSLSVSLTSAFLLLLHYTRWSRLYLDTDEELGSFFQTNFSLGSRLVILVQTKSSQIHTYIQHSDDNTCIIKVYKWLFLFSFVGSWRH